MTLDDDNWLMDDEADAATVKSDPWHVLVVDDEPDIHHVTRLALTNIDFLGRPLNIISCYTGQEALSLLRERHDIALVLLDVVMEEEDAGLKVARAIREEIGNHHIRIILRTGQPGVAPERQFIETYDINDYKAKTELTRDKLFTAVLGSLRSYNDIITIEHQRNMLEANRRGLLKVIDATRNIFRQQSIEQFAQGVLEQLQALLFFEQEALYVIVQGGFTALSQPDGFRVMYATGGFSAYCGKTLDEANLDRFRASIDQAMHEERNIFAPDHFVGFFKSPRGPANLLIIDGPVALSHPDADLIDLFCRNVAIAYENLMLAQEVEETQRSIIYQLSEVIESRSKDTGNHIRRMAEYCWILAREMGLPEDEAEIIRQASPLHDIGKVGIPDQVLHKPGRLDEAERAIINTHARLGYEMLKSSNLRILATGATIAHEHHEKWDGTGYPQGLRGEAISLPARIAALADVYDALSHARCYKKAWPGDEVLAEIRAGSGGHFDPHVVEAFLRALPRIEDVRNLYHDPE
jgi:response regulator RpfG family c-di-GMP phosphodiesterase